MLGKQVWLHYVANAKFLLEKKRILETAQTSKVLQEIRAKVDWEMRKEGQTSQMPFSFANQPTCCAEWGWPNDAEHHERVIELIKAYTKSIGWNWRIRNVIESNLLVEHHGIGSRIDDFKGCKQYSGILMKQYEAVLIKGDPDGKRSKEVSKGKVHELKKDKKPVPEKKQKEKDKKKDKKDKKDKEKNGKKDKKDSDDDDKAPEGEEEQYDI